EDPQARREAKTAWPRVPDRTPRAASAGLLQPEHQAAWSRPPVPPLDRPVVAVVAGTPGGPGSGLPRVPVALFLRLLALQHPCARSLEGLDADPGRRSVGCNHTDRRGTSAQGAGQGRPATRRR